MSSNRPLLPTTDAFLAALVRSSSDAILSKDRHGLITSWNKGAERIFGYTAAEAIGRPVTLLFPDDRLNEESAIMQRILGGELIEHYETVRRRKDGSYVEIALTVSPIIDETGKIIGASKVARDISTQRREQERWRTTLASIGDAVISTDENGRVAFMNHVAEQLTGWASDAAYGRPLAEVFRIVNETTRQAVESPVAKVIREGTSVGLANHTILIASDGTERPIDDSGAPIRNRIGQLVGIVLVFRDASERRAAELAALRLAAIVEGSDDAIIGKDLTGRITSWNPGAERLFGYAAQEMIGKSIVMLLPAGREDEEVQILARLKRGERIEQLQTIRVCKDGRHIHVSLTISPIRNDEGEIVGASKIARDITALRLAQQQLELHASKLETTVRERTAKLQAMVAELEAFSYSLSHDMRAPVRAMKSYSEIVLTDYGDRIPEAADYLRRIIRSAERLDRLIQDVLSFARLSYAEIPLVPVDVEKLIGDLVQDRPELQASVVIERPLLTVIAHEASLVQCLGNLLDNAVKFTAPNTTPRVRVFTQLIEARVRICVQDNGIGIAAAAQRRLFGMFERLHPNYEGTGLGLAIVRRAAERMGGTVGVESSPGQGSTFWIELPKRPS